jgi:hypothetical protein
MMVEAFSKKHIGTKLYWKRARLSGPHVAWTLTVVHTHDSLFALRPRNRLSAPAQLISFPYMCNAALDLFDVHVSNVRQSVAAYPSPRLLNDRYNTSKFVAQ